MILASTTGGPPYFAFYLYRTKQSQADVIPGVWELHKPSTWWSHSTAFSYIICGVSMGWWVPRWSWDILHTKMSSVLAHTLSERRARLLEWNLFCCLPARREVNAIAQGKWKRKCCNQCALNTKNRAKVIAYIGVPSEYKWHSGKLWIDAKRTGYTITLLYLSITELNSYRWHILHSTSGFKYLTAFAPCALTLVPATEHL